jgi:glutamine synthetase
MPQALINKTLQFIQEHNLKFADLRFTDTRGKEQHVTVPASIVDEEFLKEGKTFDGSSIAGWKEINDSDAIHRPALHTLIIDPLYEEPPLIMR